MWSCGLLRKLTYHETWKESTYLRAKFSRWLKRDPEYVSKQENLLRTEMFVQEGFDIYELPIVIRRTAEIENVFKQQKNVESFSTLTVSSNKLGDPSKQKFSGIADNTDVSLASNFEYLKHLEMEQIFKEVENQATTNNINSLLDCIIHTEISKVALQSLRKIVNLENKNRKLKKPVKFIANRHIVVTQLAKFIVNSPDSDMILEALTVLSRDKFNPPNNMYKDILIDEALIRCSNGDFNIQQLINITKILSTSTDFKHQEAIDYFWTGFVIKQEDIAADHLVPLFKLLTYMTRSRSRIQVLLEKKLIKNYHKLSVSQMTEIVNIFQNNLHSPVALKCASKWANMNLTSISKYDILEFIECLSASKFVNSTLEKAIEKSLLKKNMRSSDHALMAAVSVYCSTVHLRNTCIFNKVGKYFEKYAKCLPLSSFIEMIGSFGELNFEPQGKEDFWMNFEKVLDQKFLDLQVNEILYVLLSCAYINKYFPKYTDMIFSSDFLDKLHSQNNINTVQFLRDQLYLLDTAMTIECATYKGPLLFRTNKINSVFIDLRISQILNKIQSQLIKLAGGKEKLSRHVALSKLSTTGLYTLDALIHKKVKCEDALELDLSKEKNDNTAILILLPHYYCWNSTKLIGQQAMKIRHLRKLGFRVMLLDFQTLCTLHRQSDESAKYLSHAFQTAHEAF